MPPYIYIVSIDTLYSAPLPHARAVSRVKSNWRAFTRIDGSSTAAVQILLEFTPNSHDKMVVLPKPPPRHGSIKFIELKVSTDALSHIDQSLQRTGSEVVFGK